MCLYRGSYREGIEGQTDLKKDWYVSIAKLETWVSERVKELTDGSQTPVTTKPEAVPDFKVIHIDQKD